MATTTLATNDDTPTPTQNNPSSPSPPLVDNIAADTKEGFEELFPAGRVFDDMSAATEEAAHKLSHAFGFTVARSGYKIMCSRGVPPRKKPKKELPWGEMVGQDDHSRPNESWKFVGCGFSINFSAVNRLTSHMKVLAKHGVEFEKPNLDLVKVTKHNLVHCEQCNPSITQLQSCLKSSGKLFNNLGDELLQIVNLLNTASHVPAPTLRQLLRPLLPEHFPLSPQTALNFRYWVKRNAMKLKPASGKAVVFSSARLSGICNGKEGHVSMRVCEALSNKSVQECGEILQGVLREAIEEGNAGWKLRSYLERLKEADDFFDYRIVLSPEGVVRSITWQTGVMRTSFNQFGHTLFLDFSKRRLNSMDWPYNGLTMIDSDKKVVVGSESLCIGELNDCYVDILRSTVEMSGGRSLSDIQVIFGDCFIQTTLLDQLGITDTCRIFWDHYHLLQSVWPEFLGKSFSGELKVALEGMVHAKTQLQFHEFCGKALAASSSNPNHQEYIQKYIDSGEMYSTFALESAAMTLGRHGSSHAEQNHSSVMAYMNGISYEQPEILVKLLIERQYHHMTMRAHELSQYHMKMKSEVAKHPETRHNDARLWLSSWGWELWESEASEHSEYRTTVFDDFYRVSRSSVERDIQFGERCNCSFAKMYGLQCRHEISINCGTFNSTLCHARWKKRDELVSTKRMGNVIAANDGLISPGDDLDGDGDGNLCVECDDEGDADTQMSQATMEWEMLQDGTMTQDTEATGSVAARPKKKVKYSEIVAKTNYCVSRAVAMKKEVEVNAFVDIWVRMASEDHFDVKEFGREMIHLGQALSNPTTNSAFSNPTTLSAMGKENDEYKLPAKAVARAPLKRLKSKHEVARGIISKGRKGRKTCGFCRMPGHNQASCQMRSKIGIYVSGKSSSVFTMALTKLKGEEISFEDKLHKRISAVPKSTKSLCVHGVFRDQSNGAVLVRSSLYADGGILLNREYVPGNTYIDISA